MSYNETKLFFVPHQSYLEDGIDEWLMHPVDLDKLLSERSKNKRAALTGTALYFFIV